MKFMKNYTYRPALGLVFLVLGLILPSLMNAQTYQASYSEGNLSPEYGTSGKGNYTKDQSHLLLTGSLKEANSIDGAYVPILSLSYRGVIDQQFVIKESSATPGVNLEGIEVTDNGVGDLLVGIKRADANGLTTGVLASINSSSSKLNWSQELEGVDLKGISSHPRNGIVVAVGDGEDLLGQNDLRLVLLDPSGNLISARSFESGTTDGATRVIALENEEDWLVLGWQDDGALNPLLMRLNRQGETEWNYRYGVQGQVASVDDIAYSQTLNQIAVVGTAINDNRDSVLFVLLTDDAGQPLKVFYYGLEDRFQAVGKAIAAIEGLTDEAGFVLGGNLRVPSLGRFTRSLLVRIRPDGYPEWVRTYGPLDDGDIFSDGFSGLAFNRSLGTFAATGFETEASRGSLDKFSFKALQASTETGQAGESYGFCSDRLEVRPDEGSAESTSAGYTRVRGGQSTSALSISPIRWDVNYCSYPVRQGRQTTDIQELGSNSTIAREVFLYDLSGREVHQTTLQPGEVYAIPAVLPNGVYVAKYRSEGSWIGSDKLIKVRP